MNFMILNKFSNFMHVLNSIRKHTTKMEFGQTYCIDLLKRNPKKFILHFLNFILFARNFLTLKNFLELFKSEKKMETL
jgi:hypothetical protein